MSRDHKWPLNPDSHSRSYSSVEINLRSGAFKSFEKIFYFRTHRQTVPTPTQMALNERLSNSMGYVVPTYAYSEKSVNVMDKMKQMTGVQGLIDYVKPKPSPMTIQPSSIGASTHLGYQSEPGEFNLPIFPFLLTRLFIYYGFRSIHRSGFNHHLLFPYKQSSRSWTDKSWFE